MSELTVQVKEGSVRGKVSQDFLGGTFYSFLGIPYANPPVGPLRFKAPVPVDPWTGVRDATQEGPECPSRHLYFGYLIGEEEKCLHLNVFTKELPKDGENKKKPVMVWIHGGGFLYGCNKAEMFGPDYLMSQDIVLVIINYRIGVFGFLSLDDPTLDVPGNAGMKDQVLALKWVQSNIGAFNGDPDNVTIFGESAGGASVQYQYLSPLSKGLFHKAIAQSGSALNPWAIGAPNNGKIIAKYMGLDDSDDKKLLAELVSTPAPKIVKAVHKIPDPFAGATVRPFGPVIERPSPGAFLTEEPLDILKAGTFNKVPMIAGYCSREGLLNEVVRVLQSEAKEFSNDLETEIPHTWNIPKGSDRSKEIAAKMSKFYLGSDQKFNEKNLDKFHAFKTDNQFLHGIHQSVNYHVQHNVPVYLYRLSLDTQLNYFKRVCASKSLPITFLLLYVAYKAGDGISKSLALKATKGLVKKQMEGVCHADDLGYLFKGFCSERIQPDSREAQLIERFVKLWTSFAATGRPTFETTDWKPVTGQERHFLDIGEELKTGSDPEKERMQFWDSLLQ